MINVVSKVKSCINSCETPDQILSCSRWALTLSARNYISLIEYKYLSEILYLKWKEVNGPMDKRFVE